MKNRKLTDYIPLTLKGMAMGAADVVPGVSGGTMAFILNIYEELIHSLHTLASMDTFRLLIRFKFKEAIDTLPWRFLAAVGLGILISLATLSKFIKMALEEYEVLVWSFFFGLVVASIITVISKVKIWQLSRYVALLAGTVIALFIVIMTPTETPESWWFIYLSGMIAICAMILPGISGSFILVLLGKYKYILTAVTTLLSGLKNLDFQVILANLTTLLIFGAGAITGLATFAKILDWVFKKAHDVAVALLIGFMVGSLWKIWPWKETLETYTDRHGVIKPLVQENIFPAEFSSEVVIAITLAIVGFVGIIILTKMAAKTGENSSTSSQ